MSSQSEPNKGEPNNELIDAALLQYWEGQYKRMCAMEAEANLDREAIKQHLETFDKLISSAELGEQD